MLRFQLLYISVPFNLTRISVAVVHHDISFFITSILKSLVVLEILLALSSAIYSRIAPFFCSKPHPIHAHDLRPNCTPVGSITIIYIASVLPNFNACLDKVWRALRLIVDTGLHYVGLSRDDALEYFNKYAWDDTDLAKKEVH